MHCTALVLYCTVLYCTVLYCTVLCCTVLCCTVLYCTVLYCTVLYCGPTDLEVRVPGLLQPQRGVEAVGLVLVHPEHEVARDEAAPRALQLGRSRQLELAQRALAQQAERAARRGRATVPVGSSWEWWW